MKNNWKLAEKILIKSGVVILPTDTLYGIIGSAFSKKAVEKIYKIKKRNKNKPFIVLITSYHDLKKFGVSLPLLRGSARRARGSDIFSKFWPGKTSIILPCKSSKWKYIHRGKESIAFRMIGKKNKNLFNLIKKVGPIVAPSANPEEKIPAKTIKEAKDYFGENIDLYISSGRRNIPPSKIIKYEKNRFIILRN
jgi:L-threonylcarbamoyladenylate synthase